MTNEFIAKAANGSVSNFKSIQANYKQSKSNVARVETAIVDENKNNTIESAIKNYFSDKGIISESLIISDSDENGKIDAIRKFIADENGKLSKLYEDLDCDGNFEHMLIYDENEQLTEYYFDGDKDGIYEEIHLKDNFYYTIPSNKEHKDVAIWF